MAKSPRSARRRRLEVVDRLYELYSDHRARLIRHLCEAKGKSRDSAIRIAQKILDRIIIITFCEQRGFLSDQNPELAFQTLPLFGHDPEVDDLRLSTDFSLDVNAFDFNNEVSIDVLGQIFERSIRDLSRLRAGVMPKSAERKRSGIYYTPPDFTRFLVQAAVSSLVKERQATILKAHELCDEAYWRACWDDLHAIKVCDPACGGGAFLIAAYDLFEAEYVRVVNHRREWEGAAAEDLIDAIPGLILAENLYGVDLSEQAVEITQRVLWLRSARRGKTLADLSHNVIQGNSLAISDLPHAFDWKATFPAVFDRDPSGFDCVVGNPPWERLKLQEREFFADSAPEIARAVSAATRRTLIAALEPEKPQLFADYIEARRAAGQTLDHTRQSGRYPLTGQGDINASMLFAELARALIAPKGRVGLLVPSGIATDHTTKEFFADLIQTGSLIGLYDFENRNKIFPDVDGRFKFCVLLLGGSATKAANTDFVFFAHRIDDLSDQNRHISLSAVDLALLNPNTRTCPVFRSRRDAELTKAVYRRVPILIDESRQEGGNPWALKFVTMFHQTNDAELFHTAEDLGKLGLQLVGNRWLGGGRTFLPLYEAKMVQAYDHRAASVVLAEGNWVRQGQTEATSLVQHQNPDFVTQPRWWVEDSAVDRVLGSASRSHYLSYKDITSATNERTMIAAFVPHVGIVNSAPVMLAGESVTARLACCLLANLNSLCLDYVARQKVGGVHLNFFIVNQLPIFPPDHFASRCPWDKRTTLERWISDRVLKLTCTANDMRPLAEAAGFDPPVHKWFPDERANLTAELDAAFFRLYGMTQGEVETILDTFSGLKSGSSAGSLHADRILEGYERLG
jgi:N-6 DNA Methylase